MLIDTKYNIYGKTAYSGITINGSFHQQSDAGGKFLLEDNWTTFVKARLNCSLPGSYPFYFDELQSTHYVQEQGLIYAVFTTPPYVFGLIFIYLWLHLTNYNQQTYCQRDHIAYNFVQTSLFATTFL